MKRICASSGSSFEIADTDLRFYERMKVPAPTLCPAERQRRRLTWRNERTLYRRTCSATKKSIVSIHSGDRPFPVVSQSYWWSDSWSPLAFGREIDFSRPFFDQYRELQHEVPRIAMLNGANDNSEYVNLSTWNKDCYLLFESDNNRECLYCDHSFQCVNCVDASYVTRSELCYECLYCDRCYRGLFLENCEGCIDCYFLKDCIGCSDCFGCVNLRHKQYWFWNKPCSKEEYRAKLDALGLEKRSSRERVAGGFQELVRTFPARYRQGRLNDNVSGNYIWESKDCFDCYDVRKLRDCRWVCNCENSKSCYDIDVYGGDRGMELVYEGHSVGNGVFNCAFNTCLFENVSDSYYCDFCHFSSYLFGCIGVRNGRYCILNKQYPERDYLNLKERLIAHMTEIREWGEFFPASLSPFAYNETVAQEYYPLARDAVGALGLRWYEEPREERGDTVKPFDDLSSITDGKELFQCTVCSIAFRLQALELEFYRKSSIAPPAKCHECRYGARMARRLPRELHARACAVTGVPLLSPYAANKPERILSEEEFEKAVE